ncbi:MAG TPA: tail fiber domain-containing protein, partial [Candidatus Angelobacter sp.]|nr:tail fiber domain-containing protein [Candidatus Angelobacter sp.]
LNITGARNSAFGDSALFSSTGSGNTAMGNFAGYDLTTGDRNICIGDGVRGVAAESNRIRIGDNLPTGSGQSACYIGGIVGQSIDPGTAVNVGIDASGKLGTTASSRRFKRDIKPMNTASQAIHSLNPVAFHYKSDAKNTPCFGLIAEEVAAVNPDLVVRGEHGEIYSVRYDAINAMLLNEFLKEHQKVQEQAAAIAQLKRGMESLIALIKEQDSKIQKVSDRLEMRNDVLQVAVTSDVAEGD